jgi:hypothetical protein
MNKPVPVVGMDAQGNATDVAMVPYHELDSFLSELSSDFEFGVGKMHVTGAKDYVGELGKLSGSLGVRIGVRPTLKASIKPGMYGRVTPHKQRPKSLGKPKKPAGKRAVSKHRRKGRKVAILARPKPHRGSTAPVSVSALYAQLKRQGKILDLMKVQREATAEHRSLEAQSAFRTNVLKSLSAIDKKMTPGSANTALLRDRYKKLKIASGAW